MEVGSKESTRTVVIVRRYLDSNKSINTVYLKYFCKINYKSIESINTVDLTLEVGSNELTRTVVIFGRCLDPNKLINNADLKYFP